MINQDLERRFADCTELVDAWKGYLEQLNQIVKNAEFQITPDIEQRFMDTKARIAMLHDSFMEALKHDQNIGQNMLSIVNRSITLRHLRRFGQADQKKIEIEWHEVYLLLNETVSQLAEERERLSEVNEVTWRIQKVQERIFVNLKAFFRSVYFKIIVALVILVGIFYVPTLFGWDWDNLREVESISEPYGAFLDFKRDTMGLDAPYSSLEKFTAKKLVKVPAGYKAEKVDSVEKDHVASSFERLTVSGEDGRSYLNSATSFEAYQINLPEGRAPVFAYIFYWFEKGKASTFRFDYDREVTGSTDPMMQSIGRRYGAFNDQNVLVLLGSDFADLREQVQRSVFSN